ncbi:MAG: hypothetical protein RM022_010680 [Nostoc sp. EfeVER01]
MCLYLVYLRQKPIFEMLGLLFDVSKTKVLVIFGNKNSFMLLIS